MIVVDEYLAARVVSGDWPDGLPDDDDIALTAARHWRLLQRIHKPAGGQLSGIIEGLTPGELDALRFPHPEVLHVIDPRPLLDDAAEINARYNAGGLLISESLAAGLLHGRQLWFGPARNVGARLASAADDLAITIHVVDEVSGGPVATGRWAPARRRSTALRLGDMRCHLPAHPWHFNAALESVFWDTLDQVTRRSVCCRCWR